MDDIVHDVQQDAIEPDPCTLTKLDFSGRRAAAWLLGRAGGARVARMWRRDWNPPNRPVCSCAEHLEDVRNLELRPSHEGAPPTLFGELVDAGVLEVVPLPKRDRTMEIYGEGTIGPFHWGIGAGDEVRWCYDDDAELKLDELLLLRHGVDRVEWMDREEFMIGAPTLCESGIVVAFGRALADPKVRNH